MLTRIKLQNFKRFKEFDTTLRSGLNVLIGDNESGKSTILLAIELILGGNRRRVEAIGLDSLFTVETVSQFMSSGRNLTDLPELFVEVYLSEQDNQDLNGKNNSEARVCDGLSLRCRPDNELSTDIGAILEQEDASFPFEYYDIDMRTFSGKAYSGYNRYARHLLIDSSQINNEYATREYVRGLYDANVVSSERQKHQNEYRNFRARFGREVLGDLNERVGEYAFAVKTGGRANLDSDLTITEDGISIENKGKGQQCFIKTDFALRKPRNKSPIDVVLLEEPENHLSHVNMRRLVNKIGDSEDKQLFVATHSNLICARLDLRKCILLNSSDTQSASLDAIPTATAEFFMKAPDNNILEFILSARVILVEGDAEFILIEDFFKRASGESLEDSDVHVISIGGTCFSRFLDIAKLLGVRTAVVRDNDGDYQAECVEAYADYSCPHIRIFADKDNACKTFEICLYRANTEVCEDLFGEERRSLTVEEYMLNNKTESAFRLLRNRGGALSIPQYIKEAMQWIRE